MREAHEGPQPPYTNLSNHRTGLAYWRPPTSGHGTNNPPGCHVTEPDVREVTAETNRPCDMPAPVLEPGTRSRLHQRNEKWDRGSAQAEPLQPQDRQGPVQAPMSGSAPPNVAQAAHNQASRRPLTPTSHQQERLHSDNSGQAESPNSVYSTPTQTGRTFSHPLIPAPLFASPPHSRRDLDPRVPVSPYDRINHVLNSGQPSSRDTASQSHQGRNRHNTATRYTAGGIPTSRLDGANARIVGPSSANSRRVVSTASNTPASTCTSTAAASPAPSESVKENCARGSPLSSVSSMVPDPPALSQPQSQPQTKQSNNKPKSCTSKSSAGLTVIHSAALPALLPIAAAEGIVRPRPLPRPVALPLTKEELAAPPHGPRKHHRSSSANSIGASVRALRGSGSSGSYHTAAQTPRTSRPCNSSTFSSPALAPQSLNQVLTEGTAMHAPVPREMSMDTKWKRSSNDNSTEEKGTGELVGWLLRVCFCQPIGGVEDGESGGDSARRHRRMHRSVKQGSDMRQLEAQQDLAA